MTTHELREVFRDLPAGTFTVHVAERTPVAVAHTDFANISPSGGMLVVWDAEGHLHHIDALSITRITYHAPTSQPSG
jgi:hypothetical protein